MKKYFLSKSCRENDVDQIKFSKSKLYAFSGLSFDQDTASNVYLPNVEVKKALSNILRMHVGEKYKFNPGLKIHKEDYFDITVPFV